MRPWPTWKQVLVLSILVLMISLATRSLLKRSISVGALSNPRLSGIFSRPHVNTSGMAAASDSQPIPQAEVGQSQSQKESVDALPKLSSSDNRAFNRLAVEMDRFHNHFRHTWQMMYNACTANKRPQGMSIRQFLGLGLDFCHHLETHHTIEEHYVFPELARKMPLFRQREHLLGQHAEIHRGLDGFEKYLSDCRRGERELRMEEMKGLMDGFGKVLWEHLDDEVRQLGAENMRLFWTRQEIDQLGVGW